MLRTTTQEGRERVARWQCVMFVWIVCVGLVQRQRHSYDVLPVCVSGAVHVYLCLLTHRDHGPRADRQKTRLIWLIEQLGFEAFSDLVAQVRNRGGWVCLGGDRGSEGHCSWREGLCILELLQATRSPHNRPDTGKRVITKFVLNPPTELTKRAPKTHHSSHVRRSPPSSSIPGTHTYAQTMGEGTSFSPAVHVTHDTPWERRDLLGVHPQKQEGLSWVGASVPSGRIHADDLEVSRLRVEGGRGTIVRDVGSEKGQKAAAGETWIEEGG